MMTSIRFRINCLYITIKRSIYYPKWWYQRITRGFSDRDMWSADHYLSGVFAGILQWYVDKSMGIPTAYALEDDPYCEDLDAMTARRDEDYLFYASIFKEYAVNGPAFNEEWVKEFGGVLDEDIQAAVQWLSEHFTELWD